jgi:hypothetical protein
MLLQSQVIALIDEPFQIGENRTARSMPYGPEISRELNWLMAVEHEVQVHILKMNPSRIEGCGYRNAFSRKIFTICFSL